MALLPPTALVNMRNLHVYVHIYTWYKLMYMYVVYCLQIHKITDDGLKFKQLYNVDKFPYVAIVDPRTGTCTLHIVCTVILCTNLVHSLGDYACTFTCVYTNEYCAYHVHIVLVYMYIHIHMYMCTMICSTYCTQWNHSNLDTLGTEESVRCPDFWGCNVKQGV